MEFNIIHILKKWRMFHCRELIISLIRKLSMLFHPMTLTTLWSMISNVDIDAFNLALSLSLSPAPYQSVTSNWNSIKVFVFHLLSLLKTSPKIGLKRCARAVYSWHFCNFLQFWQCQQCQYCQNWENFQQCQQCNFEMSTMLTMLKLLTLLTLTTLSVDIVVAIWNDNLNGFQGYSKNLKNANHLVSLQYWSKRC